MSLSSRLPPLFIDSNGRPLPNVGGLVRLTPHAGVSGYCGLIPTGPLTFSWAITQRPQGSEAALDSATFADALFTATTLVHLVGTPHPGPSKAAEFERVDLASIRSSVEAARRAQIAHLVYISVAQPAPVMRAYVAARAKGEAAIVEARLTATMLRPWYVLGPDHWWPIALKPIYWLAERLPATREVARRMGLVTLAQSFPGANAFIASLAQMVAALVQAVEHPPATGTVRIIDIPAIRGVRLPGDAQNIGLGHD